MEVDVKMEDDEADTYEPLPVALHDGGVIILDPIEFAEVFNCYAAQFYEGILYVLDRDSRQWHNVEPDKPKRQLKPVN